MPQHTLPALVAVAACLAAQPAGRVAFTADFLATERPAKPRSAAKTTRYLYAVRRDGSIATRYLTGRGAGMATFTSMADNQSVTLDLETKRKATSPLSRARRDQLAFYAIDPMCAGNSPPGAPSILPWNYGGTENLAGMETRRYIRENDQSRITEWRAPSLNCFVVKRVTEQKDVRFGLLHNRPGVVKIITQDARVTPGEPDSALFAAPPGFKEVPYEQLQRKR